MKLNKRFLALLLAVAMMLGMLPIFAAADDEPTCTCGTETDEHTTECALYVAPAPTCTCGTETEEHTTECALYAEPTQPEKTFAQSLLELTALEELYAAILSEENAAKVQSLTHAELEAVKTHTNALYAAIAEPSEQDGTYLAGIVNTLISVPAYSNQEPTCTCGTETDEHTTECALYKAPEEPTCTCGTETEEHTTECALYKAPEEPTCTCGTETEEHTAECALYAAPEEPTCTCGTETDDHGEDCPLYVFIPPVNYTRVGPLMPAVAKQSKLRFSAPRTTTPTVKDAQGLETKKSVTKNDDGSYTLTLEAWATGESVTTTTTNSTPTDIVLVLDQTSSMDSCINCGYNENANVPGSSIKVHSASGSCSAFESRIAALKAAATAFVDNVYANSSNSGNRIAVVGFCENGSQGVYRGCTILSYFDASGHRQTIDYNQANRTVDDFGDELPNYYQLALRPISTEAEKNKLHTSVQSVTTYSGSTHHYVGLDMAERVFAANPIEGETRNRVVILFTDGMPSTHFNDSEYPFQYLTENYTIQNAYDLKNIYNATVYTVGVFGTANANDITGANKFMHLVSSNNPNATSYSDTAATGNYYLSAGDTTALNTIFTGISQEITTGGSSITLGTDAVLKDVVSEYFTLDTAEGTQNSDIKVYTAECNGKDGDSYTFDDPVLSDLNPTVDGNTVSVTGFDYAGNWVGTNTDANGEVTYQGQKLIIEIPIKVKGGFLGGNGVPTNAEGSGVYKDGEEIESFVSPTADVPIDLNLNFLDTWNIYLKGDLTLDAIKAKAQGHFDDYINQFANWQTEYIELDKITIYKDNVEVTGDLTDLTENQSYTVKLHYKPKYDGEHEEEIDTANGLVKVFMPTIAFRDSAVNAGDTPDYTANGGTGNDLIWKNGTTVSTAVTMTGDEPTLTYTYDPTAAATYAETDVKVTVKMGDESINEYVTFYREACNGQIWSCDFERSEVTGNDANFVVHIKTFDLIIQKDGVDEDAGAPFVFHIQGEDVSMDVVVYGNGSVKITGLPVGEYTVTETTGYWRYTLAPAQTFTPEGAEKTVTFKNNLSEEKWLDDWASATNHFGS